MVMEEPIGIDLPVEEFEPTVKPVADNTYIKDDAPLDSIVPRSILGDPHEVEFFPRLKTEKWQNEVNLSIGPADVTEELASRSTYEVVNDTLTWFDADTDRVVRMYPLTETKSVPVSSLRRVFSGELSPQRATALYETPRNLPTEATTGKLLVSDYVVTEPSLMVFDQMPVSRYLDVDERGYAQDFNYDDKSAYHPEDVTIPSYDRVPVVRLYSPFSASANPYYMDAGLHTLDIQYGHNDVDARQLLEEWCGAVADVLARYGVEVIRPPGNTKLFFQHGERTVKFSTAEAARGVLLAYINVDSSYNKAYDFYRPDVEKDIRHQYAYGLAQVNPRISHDVVSEIIVRLAERLGISVEDRPYQGAEQSMVDTIEKLQASVEWIKEGQRQDANWFHREPIKEGFEFEIEFASPPPTNVVDLSIRTKGLRYHYQGPLTAEEIEQGHHRSPHVVGSYAAYHEDDTKTGNNYQSGKAFHIYRPIAHDANGWSVFCDLNIDMDTELMSVTVPEDFLANASYPVVVDPTLGYTTQGGSAYGTVNGDNVGYLVQTPRSGTVTSITAQIYRNLVTTATIDFAIYKGGNFIEDTVEDSTTGDGDGLLTLAMDNNTAVSGDIWLRVGTHHTESYGGFIQVVYDSVAGATSGIISSGYSSGVWSEGIGTVTERRYTIYANWTPNYPMKAPIFGNEIGNTPATNNYNFLNATTQSAWNATETNRNLVIPYECNLRDLTAVTLVAPGAGSPTKSRTFTVTKNGSVTTLAAAITSTNVSGTDSSNVVNFAAGDTVSMLHTTANTPAASTDNFWTMMAEADGQIILTGTNQTPSNSAERYLAPFSGDLTAWVADENDVEVVVPCAGQFSQFYVRASAAPGAAKSFTFALRVNGSDSALATTISGAAQTTNVNSSDVVSVQAGDTLSIHCTPSGTPTTAEFKLGLLFVPSILGQSFVGFGTSDSPSTTATRYEQPHGSGGAAWNATESIRQSVIGPVTLKKFYALVGTAPGAGNTWTVTIRQNASPTSLSVAIVDSNTTNNVTADVVIAATDKISMELVPDSNPSAMTDGFHMGLLMYVAPAFTANPRKTIINTQSMIRSTRW